MIVLLVTQEYAIVFSSRGKLALNVPIPCIGRTPWTDPALVLTFAQSCNNTQKDAIEWTVRRKELSPRTIYPRCLKHNLTIHSLKGLMFRQIFTLAQVLPFKESRQLVHIFLLGLRVERVDRSQPWCRTYCGRPTGTLDAVFFLGASVDVGICRASSIRRPSGVH